MFKMEIQMDEEKILRENVINLQKVYAYLDKLFAENGLIKDAQDVDGTLHYYGVNPELDFGACCTIAISISDQKWFAPNCKKWFCIDNEDNPDVWDREDMLELVKSGKL